LEACQREQWLDFAYLALALAPSYAHQRLFDDKIISK
jgi:hypothetical protein